MLGFAVKNHGKISSRGLSAGAVFALWVLSSVDAKEAQPEPMAAPAPAVEAWAMLFQMMDRLHSTVAQGELSLVHKEDPVASAAVSALLLELGKSSAPDIGARKIAWIGFVRDISALHTAADAAREDVCLALMKKMDTEFQQLQQRAAPALLKAAHQYAERFTCPMHPDVVGSKDDTCPKCGMLLDQPVVLLPSGPIGAILMAQNALHATISTDAPLEPGKPTHAMLHLRRGVENPVTPAELIETHTQKIHLLIIDGSLTDYHHVHPQPTSAPGDYAFEFTPRKPGPYLAWADVRPTPMGLQEYEKAVIAGNGKAEPLRDTETKFSADVEGLHYHLVIEKREIKVGEVAKAKLRVTKPDGTGFQRLEPVMGAFAHLVGFNEDAETVLHMHPTGAPVLNETDRGGPELEFRIYATKPGFTRLFAQVQIDGRQVFAPFGVHVMP
jgi:hypothetical protein